MPRGKKAKTQEDKMDVLIRLNQTLVAIELTKGGVTQEQIGKILQIAKGSVNALIKGYKNP